MDDDEEERNEENEEGEEGDMEEMERIQTILRTLEDNQIIEPQPVFEQKSPPNTLQHPFFTGYFISKGISEGISPNGVVNCLSKIETDYVKELKQKNNSISFSKSSKSIFELLPAQHSVELVSPIKKMQDAIKLLKLKDYQENKDSIGLKIKHLEENIKLIELTEGNDMTLNNQSIIQENILKSRVKEIKTTKSVLEEKLFCLENQIKLLMREEAEKDRKKQNIKNYLDNFEKDKKEIEARSKEFEKKREERLKYLKEVNLRAELKVKERYEKEEEEKSRKQEKKSSDMEDKIFRMQQKSIDFREEQLRQREEWRANRRSLDGKQYIHQKYEEMFKANEEKYLSELNQKHEEETLKRKIQLKPIKHEELDSFQHKYEEDRQKLILEREKRRILEKEEIKNHALNDIKSNSLVYYRLIEEEKMEKEKQEKQKLEKNFTSMRRNNFSKIIKDNMPPKINPEKRKEIENRMLKIKTSKLLIKGQGPYERKPYNRSKIIVLRKRDPNKPNKYKWKLNLSLDNEVEEELKKQKRPKSHYGGFNNSFNKSNFSNRTVGNLGASTGNYSRKNFSVDKRVPLLKNPDYLAENRIKKSHSIMSHSVNRSDSKKWNKMLNNNKNSLIANVEQVKLQANLLEKQAKMKGKFLSMHGGSDQNPELGREISNKLLESIKAKLSILDNISKYR